MANISTDDDTLNSSIDEAETSIESVPNSGIIDLLVNNGITEEQLTEWNGYSFSSSCSKFVVEYGKFRMIKKVLTEDNSKPNLVAMAGFSESSFCGSTKVIVENLHKIKDMFNCVYVICFTGEVINKQTKACSDRDDNIAEELGLPKDELLKKLKDEEFYKSLVTILKNKEVRKRIFKPETDLNEILGKVVDKLIRCAGITNVHLLGKCAGGGVAIHTFTKSDIYQALYLAVPASPTNVEHLRTIDLGGRKIIIAWDKRDAYPFTWGKSNQEKASYVETLKKLGDNYEVKEFNEDEFNNGESHPKNYHEIPKQLFNLIAESLK